jgi:hypothetical protein
MRRLVVLIIIALLGIAPIGIVGRSASAQGSSTPTSEDCKLPYNPEVPWSGVCRPIREDATDAAPFQPYAVEFKAEFAATEVIGNGTEDQAQATEVIGNGTEDQAQAEFMVVHVKAGNFVLDLDRGSQPVVVSTSQNQIDTRTPWDEVTPYATTAGPLMFNGAVCTLGCPVSPGEPVLLVPGDVAIAEKGALCLYCLLHGNTGLLEVFVLLPQGSGPEDFTWIRDWDNFGAPPATPSASTEPAVMAWAFLNPGRCDHG